MADLLPRITWNQLIKPVKDEFNNDKKVSIGMIKQNCPVRTGALRRGIHSSLTREDRTDPKLTFDILSEQGYFVYVDSGTRYITPRRFSQPALDYLQDKGYSVSQYIRTS